MYKGKHENQFYDVSTEELKQKAFLSLFNYLDGEYNQYYDSLKNLEEPSCSSCHNIGYIKLNEKEFKCPDCLGYIVSNRRQYNSQKKEEALYEKAKTGDCDAAMTLLSLRKKYQYEEWDFYDVK